MSTATQEWVNNLTIMQQSVIISAIRGPDGVKKFHKCKNLVRWYRRCVLISAFDGKIITNPHDKGGGSFTGPSITYRTFQIVGLENVVNDYISSSDDLPHHYLVHFMHAVEILGYKHPQSDLRNFWFEIYERLAHYYHLYPESEEQMDLRLSDIQSEWEDRTDEAACCSD